MSRRVSLPGAAELFRPTTEAERGPAPLPQLPEPAVSDPPTTEPSSAPQESVSASTAVESREAGAPGRTPRGVRRAMRDLQTPVRGSGRVRHEEKITVYVSQEELLALEQARLSLRAGHGVAVDRGRIVREAISALLADFADRGDESELVRRLSAR